MLEVGQRVEGLVDVPVGVLVEVVLDHEPPVVLDAAHQLLELQRTRRPSTPSSTMSSSISSAMRRTISVRWSTVTTSRTVTRSSTSRADRAP